MDKNRLEESDRNRRLAHDALVDSLNALSRAFHKADKDNEWRREIGLDRNAIADWAEGVAKHLSEERENENLH